MDLLKRLPQPTIALCQRTYLQVASRPADSEFASGDPADYRSLMGSAPKVVLDSSRDPGAYREEISLLIGTGYLALAEAALTKL